MTMKTKEENVLPPSKQLRQIRYARIQLLRKALEEEILGSSDYDMTRKDLLCILSVQVETVQNQTQTILKRLDIIESNISLKGEK